LHLPDRQSALESGALLASILIIAACALMYELLIGSLSSYLRGDSILQFSLTIGVFLSAMGAGSYLSRYVRENLLQTFLFVEIAIGVLGGCSAALLLGADAAFTRSYEMIMFAVLAALGTLIGLEIPLLTRIARRYGSLRETLANVLAFDYLGALIASLLFPLILLPYLGLAKTAFLVGLFNLGVVGINLRVFGRQLPSGWAVGAATVAAAALLVAGFAQSAALTSVFEQRLYQDQIIFADQSRYQRIVVTRYQDDVRLYLDGELQLSSRDEYRYHEALVHPAMAAAMVRENVLVIGGGDGMVLRELLKYPDVRQITLIDIDPAMTHLGQTFAPIVKLNGDAMRDPRVTVRNEDGYRFLADSSDLYNVIIADLPDPRVEGLVRLYSRDFYGLVGRHLARGGAFVTQASSPYYVRKSFWCVAHTAAAAGMQVYPYHAYVPSFGDWGFVLATDRPIEWSGLRVPGALRFLSTQMLGPMRTFDADEAEMPTEISTLENPIVQRYYLEGWRLWRM
jgi:spermidine synthase